MPPAMSSTWARQMPSSGKGISGSLPGEELLEQVGDLRGVAGAVDAAGLDDHAGQALLAIIRLAIRCASSLVSS